MLQIHHVKDAALSQNAITTHIILNQENAGEAYS